MDSLFTCEFCSKQFKYKYSLRRHLNQSHNVQHKKILQPNLKCPESNCLQVFGRRNDLRDHIQASHNVKMEFMWKKFASFQGFKTWKTSIENEMNCLYTLKFTSKGASQYNEKIYHYLCFRSGDFHSKSNGKKPSTRSKKMNACCPSSMKATLRKDKVRVEFWKTHYGHGNEMEYFLSKKKRKIANKLKEEESCDKEEKAKCDDKTFNPIEKLIIASHIVSKDCDKSLSQNVSKNQQKILTNKDKSTYMVEKAPNAKCNNDCLIKCVECNVCIHMHESLCNDNFSKLNLCKHIHTYTQSSSSTLTPKIKDLNFKNNEFTIVCNPVKIENNLLQSHGRIEAKFKLLSEKLKKGKLDKDSYVNLENLIDKCLNLFNNSSNISCIPETQVTINEKIKPKILRLKSNHNNTLSKLRKVEYIHTGLDHIY